MNRAFTLVELAIVIVIIGLLVGGVLQGQELIKQAKIRKAIRDFQGYHAALITFQGKYNCLAGDCLNAHLLLGPTAISGNGDGYFGNFNSQGVVTWQHLTLAKMVKGSYTGTQANANHGMCKRGIECPLGAFENTTYFTLTTNWASPNPFSMGKKNVILMYNGDGHIEIVEDGHVSPEDAYSMDLKVDDGVASSGLFYTFGSGGFYYANTGAGWINCLTDATGKVYNMDTNRTVCRPLWLVGL